MIVHQPLTHKDAIARTNQLAADGLSYTYHIKVMPGTHYEGLAEITLKLRHLQTGIFLDYSGQAVLSLHVNSKPSEMIDYDDSRIHLPKQHLTIGANYIVIRYRTRYDGDGNGCVSFIDNMGSQYLYTQFAPYYCNRVFPCFDQPDLKAVMSITIVAPRGWIVRSNEQVVYTVPFTLEDYMMNANEGCKELLIDYLTNCQDSTIHFHPPTKPLSTYLYCFIAGQYACVPCPNPYKGLNMSIYCINQVVNYVKRMTPFVWEITSLSMQFYQSFFGRDFPFSKYEQVFAPEFKWGAMENAGIVTINNNNVFIETPTQKKQFNLARIISHELSHHWFGNLVTMRWWDDVWLNQSFADIASFVCLEKIRQNVTTFSYKSAMATFQDRKNWGYKDDSVITTHPIRGTVQDTEQAESIFDGITYSKGAAVLKQLMHIIGEESFSRALGQYFKRYAWGNTVLEDFMSVMQEEFKSDRFSLQGWKKQWIETACHNTLEVVSSTDGKELKLAVRQECVLEGYPTLRTHKIQIALFYEDCTKDLLDVWVEPKETTAVGSVPAGKYAAILPNFGDYTFAKLHLDPESTAFFSRNVSKIQDSLSRALIWKAFSDMVADARLPSGQFIDIFLRNAGEQDCDILFEVQVEAAITAIEDYTPPLSQATLSDKIFYYLIDQFQSWTLTRPTRLLLLKSRLFRFAKSQQSIQVLLRWYRQEYEPLQSCKMNFSQEWEAVVKAFTLKSLTLEEKEYLFQKIAARSHSETTENKRFMCDALGASREEYQSLYQSFVSNGSVRPSLRLASMTGFVDPVHRDWMEEEYARRYFEDLPKVAKLQQGDPAVRFLVDLQPNCYSLRLLIEGYEKVIPQISGDHRLRKKAELILHNLRKREKAHMLFETACKPSNLP